MSEASSISETPPQAVPEHAGPTSPAPQPAPQAAPSFTHGTYDPPRLASSLGWRRYYTLHMLGALFPLTMGFAVYGWRAVGVFLVVFLSAAAGAAAWRRIGSRGPALRWGHVLWMSELLSLMLPAHLLSDRIALMPQTGFGAWAVLVGGALLLVFLTWLLGAAGHPWVHPLLLTYLALVILFSPLITPHFVLHRAKMLMGDVLDVGQTHGVFASREVAWLQLKERPARDALYIERSAADSLTKYTRGQRVLERERISLDAMLRDAMPPLDDLVVGGHPGPIGTSSAIGVIIGGLFLLYRSLIDYRVPLLIILVAFLSFLVLPVPVLITSDSTQYYPLFLPRATTNWAMVITFANYEMLASPLLFVAFFMATSPTIAPASREGRAVFAILVGFLSAASQLYISCAVGPYIALLVADLLTPWLDERFSSDTLAPA